MSTMVASPCSFVRPGNLLVAGQTLGEPTVLIEELFRTAPHVPDLRLFGGMTLTEVFASAPANFSLSSFVGMGLNGELMSKGRMDLVPCHMSDLPRCLRDGRLKPDVALVLVSPPDSDGLCSLGLTADYISVAVATAGTVLAEINETVPRLAGDTTVPYDRIDAFVRTDRPLPEHARAMPTDAERAIARNLAPWIRSGSCLLLGIGRIGEAVLEVAAGQEDIGVHSGMVGDTILEMARDGIINNTKKGVDTGLTVAGSVLGSGRAVKLAAADPHLTLRSVDYTHNPEVIARLGHAVCVNSAVEVDLFGQVNAETADGRYVGGVGGSVDFLRGVARGDGRSIVALPSTARGGTVSRIVPVVRSVTASRSDVDLVVTEYGTADLRGRDEGARAGALIELAAPQHRQVLRSTAREMGL